MADNRSVTYPRSHLVDRHNGGCYHCISRCVRQAWLCGQATHAGPSFEHRSAWLEERILVLARVFAVDVYAYAVMSNHYHVVVHVRPEQARGWCDLDVARRWMRVCSARTLHGEDERIHAFAEDAERIARCRERLGNLSWFMRFINEPMARIANREDERTGRFWDGRFRSIALLDESALLACVAYVDLNPVRAGIADSPERSRGTSVRHRVKNRKEDALTAIGTSTSLIPVSLEGYLEILRWIIASESDRGLTAPASVETVLKQSGRSSADWVSWMRSQRLKRRAYGNAQTVQDYTASIGQFWVKQ
ncbi:MAG: transposase [Gemmatimonadetes bacterium]|nr:MAG: transposase [Gemmatimonadota bacterium]